MLEKCFELIARRCSENEKCCVVICGPTASGKSALALTLSHSYPVNIINADSRQVSREFPILTDIPSESELSAVPHFLYKHKSIADRYTSFDWSVDAASIIRSSFAEHRMPVLVGGTGFYIRNLIDGHIDIPTRKSDLSMFSENELHNLVTQFGVEIPQGDKYRIARNAELLLTTGRSLSSWNAQIPERLLPDVHFVTIYLRPSREYILTRCARRIDTMFPDVLDEVEHTKNLEIMPKIIGLTEILAYMQGTSSLTETKTAILTKTMQYAKRQKTWFDHQINTDVIIRVG